MIYLSVFLFLCSLYFGIKGLRSGSKDAQYFALCLFIGALGSMIVSVLAYSALQIYL